MSNAQAITGCTIFDGEQYHEDAALLCQNNTVSQICRADDIPSKYAITDLKGGLLAPGFVDLQVNGGGGILFNHQPDVEAIRQICQAHARFGTTAMLPTLITDTRDITAKAIEAGIEAHQQSVPGFLGLHLEGPHLSVAKKGAHAASLIRPMDDDDLNLLLEAKHALPCLMVTLAPESVTSNQIAKLADAGIIVSLGHTNASYKNACTAVDVGASCITHLYNAMSPLTHQEPGLVGTALTCGAVYAGLIADGHHVKPAAIKIALSAKQGPGAIFLVTDAMATIGTDMRSFELNGRTITRQNGRLVLEDGTLAGADLDMASAVRYMHNTIGVNRKDALNMASLTPALCIGISSLYGHLSAGARADFIHFDDELQISQVWQNGELQL